MTFYRNFHTFSSIILSRLECISRKTPILNRSTSLAICSRLAKSAPAGPNIAKNRWVKKSGTQLQKLELPWSVREARASERLPSASFWHAIRPSLAAQLCAEGGVSGVRACSASSPDPNPLRPRPGISAQSYIRGKHLQVLAAPRISVFVAGNVL